MASTNINYVIENSVRYEKRGEYEKTLKSLSPFWDDASNFPKVKGLTKLHSAEIFLRCGSIAGCLSNTRQDSNLKTLSSNLLAKARKMFKKLKITEKIAECDNHLALNYWRTGALNESFQRLEESFSHDLSENSLVRLHSYIIKAFLLLDTNQPQKVISEYLILAPSFANCDDDYLKGCFYNELGLAYKQLPNVRKAITCLILARTFFEKAKHKSCLAATENSIAQLYSSEKQVMKALRSSKAARKIFDSLGDKTKISLSIDTTAQILLKHKYYKRALIFSNRAIKLLEYGQAYHNLVTSYQTKIKILAKLEHIPEMLETMAKAYNIAAPQIGEEFAREIIAQTAIIIPQIEQKVPYKQSLS